MEKKKQFDDLYNVLAGIDDKAVLAEFLDDLCTHKEVEQMAQRIAAARLLMEGKTYTQVIEETNISSATLSRVSRCVKYSNGYNKILRNK